MKHFKKILCAVESEKECKPFLERAVRLAETNQASLTVIDMAPLMIPSIGTAEGGSISVSVQDAMVNSHARELEALVDPYRKRAKIKTKILVGTPFLEIIREVLSGLHDLVIKMPESQHWAHRFFGSDDMHLLRKCPCPVWLIKPGAPDAYRCILAAVDVDDGYAPQEMETRRALNHEIIERATAIAVADSAELHIAHAWQAVSESALRHSVFVQKTEKEVDIYVDQVRQHHNASLEALLAEVAINQGQASLDYLEPKTHLINGWARQVIPALAKNIGADVVVMGTVARTGVPGFIIGNTAETILNHLDCSVLAIKPPGFVTPIKLGG